MNNYFSRLFSKYERPASFLAPASYLIAMALVIGKLDISLYLKIASSIPLIAFGMLAFPGFTNRLNRQTRAAILAVGLGGIAAVLCYRLNNSWIDHHGFNGAVWSIFARVIDRHGFINTGGHCWWTGGSRFVASAAVYDHHPPGLAWILAIAFRLCGVHESVARAIPVLFSLLGVVSLTALLTRRMGLHSGASILPILLASPGFAYFGRMVNFEPVIIGLSLTFYSWLLLRPVGRWTLFGLTLIILAAPLIGWVGAPFAAGAAFALAKRRFGWGNLPSLAFVLLPLTVFCFCVLYNSDWGRYLPHALNRAGAWNSFLHKGIANYSAAEWLRRVVTHSTALMPWPLWILVALLPFVKPRKILALVLLGTIGPFVMMIPLMPHAVFVHDYHMFFWWPVSAVSFACLIAKFRTPAAALALSLLLLYPVAIGLRAIQEMHAKGGYALHQARAGISLNAVSNPEAAVAVINTTGDPAPILAFYLDRHYRIFSRLDMAATAPGWDYYCFLHKFRGLSNADLETLSKHFTIVPDTYTPVFKKD